MLNILLRLQWHNKLFINLHSRQLLRPSLSPPKFDEFKYTRICSISSRHEHECYRIYVYNKKPLKHAIRVTVTVTVTVTVSVFTCLLALANVTISRRMMAVSEKSFSL